MNQIPGQAGNDGGVKPGISALSPTARHNRPLNIPLRTVVHGGDGEDLVQERLMLTSAGVQGHQGEFGAVEVVMQVVEFHLDGRLVAGADDVLHIVLVAHFGPMREQVHRDKHVLLHPLGPQIVQSDVRVLHHIVQETGLLLRRVLAHQAHGQHMRHGRIPHHILHPVMGLDGNPDDIFDRCHRKKGSIFDHKDRTSLYQTATQAVKSEEIIIFV